MINLRCCGLEPIRNVALGKEFFVCKECKKEVLPTKEAGTIADSAYDELERLAIERWESLNKTINKAGYLDAWVNPPVLTAYWGYPRTFAGVTNEAIAEATNRLMERNEQLFLNFNKGSKNDR